MRNFRSIFLLLLTAILAWSCSDKSEIIQEPNKPIMEKRKVQISATFGTDTRTSLSADDKVLWGIEDEIKVFYEQESSKFVSLNTEPSETAVFEGWISVPSNEEYPLPTLYAVYPYTAAQQMTSSGNSIAVNLPAEQKAVKGTFADDLSLSVGRSNSVSMTFYNVCGLMEFSVERDDIEKVILRDNSTAGGTSLAGSFVVFFGDDGRPKVDGGGYFQKEISIANSDGSPLIKGEKYYMVVLPKAFNGNELSFEFTTTEGDILEKVIAEPVTIARSNIKSFLNADEGAVSTQYVDFGDDAVFKNYCLTNFDSNGDGKISMEEAEAVMLISVNGAKSLKGIEHFVNITELAAQNIENDEDLDLSTHHKIRLLRVSNSNISQIKLSAQCMQNTLVLLEIPNNPNLTTVGDGSSQSFRSLGVIVANGSPIKGLILTGQSSIAHIIVDDLDAVEMSNSIKLTQLDITGNKDKDYTFSKFYNVERFKIGDFRTLDFTDAVNLSELTFGSSVCESVDLSTCPRLQYIKYTGSALKSLDISSCSSLTSFNSQGSGLPKLVVGVGQQISPSVDETTQIVQKGSSSTEGFTRD